MTNDNDPIANEIVRQLEADYTEDELAAIVAAHIIASNQVRIEGEENE